MLDLETLIRDWHRDETSDQFAQEAGAFQSQFVNHFSAAGTSPAEIQQHVANVWLIGALVCRNDHPEPFPPAACLNESFFIDEIRFRLQDFPDKLASYEKSRRELKRYVRGRDDGDEWR